MENKKKLSAHELNKIEKRIMEIENIYNLCNARWDLDVIRNLEIELDSLISALENNLKKINLKLIKS